MKNPAQEKGKKEKKPAQAYYVPDVFEAAVLKQMKKKWRFYESKEDFDATMKNISEQKSPAPYEKTPIINIARNNTLLTLGMTLDSMDNETLDAVEDLVRKDKGLWKKLQAIHLYNSCGFKPEIDLAKHTEYKNAAAVMAQVTEKLQALPKGTFKDGRYEASKDERNVNNTLRNYGITIYYPRKEEDLDNYFSKMEKAFKNITKRDDFRMKTRKDKTMSKPEFQLTQDQIEQLGAVGIIEYTDITSQEIFEAKLKDAQKQQATAENSPEGKEEEVKAPEEDAVVKDEKAEDKTKEAEGKTKEGTVLNVNLGEDKKNANTEEKVMPEWVQKKAKWYSEQAAAKKITDYQQDTTKEGFAAKFNGGEVHYTSPDNVNVSKDAGYKVFDTILKEDDNKGRPVNIPENASPEMATRLFAACIMNENPPQGNIPQVIDEKALEGSGLTDEQIAKVKGVLEEMKRASMEQQRNAENTGAEQGEQQTFSNEKKAQIKEALNNQYELAQKENILARGKDIENKQEFDTRVEELKNKQEEDKKLLIESFKENPSEFRGIINEVLQDKNKNEEGNTITSGLSKEQTAGQAAVRQTHIDALREKLGRTETPNRSDRRTEIDNINKANLGITEEYTDKQGNVHKPLEGEARTEYIVKNKISEHTYKRLGGQDQEVAKTCAEKNPPIQQLTRGERE